MVDNTFGRSDVILKPNGDKITRATLLEDALNFYQDAYQKKLTDICDFSIGSEVRTLHESFLVEVFSLYKEMYRNAKMKFVLDSSGQYLDRLGCEFHLQRQKPKSATGSVTFTANETFGRDIVIPAGTIILAKGTGYEYVLTEDVTITGVSTPTNGVVESRLKGAAYNAKPHTLTAFQNLHSIHRTIKVVNNGAITGGEDGESDDDFRARILSAKREKSWGTASTYENDIIANVYGEDYGVHDVQFVDPQYIKEHEEMPPHYKDGTNWESIVDKDFATRQKYYCTSCTRVLFVNGTMKPCTDKLLQAVEYYVTQQNNLVIGHHFHVQAADVVPVYLGMELYVDSSVSEDTIYAHLSAFFDGGYVESKEGSIGYSGVQISESVSKNALLDVLENIPGIHQVGSLHLLKYNPDLNLDDYAWVDYHDNTYGFTDDDGFSFTRRTVAPEVYDFWGWKNFTEIPCEYGQVLTVGDKSSVDPMSKSRFKIETTVLK